MGATDVEGLGDEELGEALVDLQRHRAALEAAEARLIAAWDARGAWAPSGAKSGAAWLARKTRAPKAACGARLWLGRQVRDMPLVAAAWEAGDIDAAHVRRLALARNPRTAELFARDEAFLVGKAQELTFSAFCTLVDYWRLAADPDGADRDAMERRERRRVSLDETFTGMFAGSILLDPVAGTIVATELRHREQELCEADWAEAKARLGREPHVHELARTPDQRRADALVEMAQRSASTPKDARAPRPLITVVTGADRFAHLLQLSSGRVLSPAEVLPLLDEAQLERILFAAFGSRVIEVSRRRLFVGALRRLIEVRDQFCFHDYCEEPADRCQVDHVQPWTAGGMTCQENGRLACGKHNRDRNGRPPPSTEVDDDDDAYDEDDP